MNANKVRDEIVENQVRAHLGKAHCQGQPSESRLRELHTEDDEALQEGAARFRAMQRHYEAESAMVGDPATAAIDYAKHGGDDDYWVQGIEADRKAQIFAGGIIFGIVVVLCVLLLWALLAGKAHAQTATPTLVRSCPSLPSGNGFSACSNSAWSLPGPNLILDVQRASVDLWITPAQLMAGDTVFACEDATISPGPFKNCPSLLPGQTNNYLLASLISFGQVTPPPTTNGTLTLTWTAPTRDSTGAAIVQPLSYQVFTRETDCATPGPQCQPDYVGTGGPQGLRPPAADVSATKAVISLAPGSYCAEVMAYFTGSPLTLGPPPDQEWCGTIGAGLVTPGNVTNVHVVTP